METILGNKMVFKYPKRKSRLPWNNVPVLSSGELYSYLSERLPNFNHELPASITLFSDLEIEESDIISFLNELPFQLECEFHKRNARRERFVNLGLFSDRKIDKILTGHRHVQPWILYFSKEGGLGISAQSVEQEHLTSGVIPCTSMPNHGVAWIKTSAGDCQVWLATARKVAHDWDWDSDIGHESAHSSFAPVPLFVQALHINSETMLLDNVSSFQDLNASHLARMSYIYSEIAVIAMRGEQRNTKTGLPVVERPEELYAFLELSHQLMSDLGFNRALTACQRANGQIDINSDEIFEIGAAVMRVLPRISKLTNHFAIPTIDCYKSIK